MINDSFLNVIMLKKICRKRPSLIYYRGRPPGKYKVKKGNKISNFRIAVTFKSHCGLFAFKNRNNLSQRGKACKQID